MIKYPLTYIAVAIILLAIFFIITGCSTKHNYDPSYVIVGRVLHTTPVRAPCPPPARTVNNTCTAPGM